MITIEKSPSYSLTDYKIFKDKEIAGVIFEKRKGDDFPAGFQVTGDGRRTFYSTLEDCVKHFI